MTNCIETIIRGPQAHVALNRPQVHNAFDDALIAALTTELKRLDEDSSVRHIVLTGRGKTFSAGADLNWMRGMAAASEADNRADAMRLAELLRTLNFLSKPTIARVNGSAYGGGIGLIAACDIAIGVHDAKFCLSEVKLGLVPATIAPYVVAAIGVRQARRLFLNAEIIDGNEALHIGLLHQCVDHAGLDEAVDRHLHFLTKGGPQAQHEAKLLALRAAGMDRAQAEQQDARNADLIARLRVSSEGQHGITSFLDKHKPDWANGSR
ncbi:MAG: enoyl-CoA hydratase-related protein [Rhodanobacteraceae bacterium]